jgi:hypothetical protein
MQTCVLLIVLLIPEKLLWSFACQMLSGVRCTTYNINYLVYDNTTARYYSKMSMTTVVCLSSLSEHAFQQCLSMFQSVVYTNKLILFKYTFIMHPAYTYLQNHCHCHCNRCEQSIQILVVHADTSHQIM